MKLGCKALCCSGHIYDHDPSFCFWICCTTSGRSIYYFLSLFPILKRYYRTCLPHRMLWRNKGQLISTLRVIFHLEGGGKKATSGLWHYNVCRIFNRFVVNMNVPYITVKNIHVLTLKASQVHISTRSLVAFMSRKFLQYWFEFHAFIFYGLSRCWAP